MGAIKNISAALGMIGKARTLIWIGGGALASGLVLWSWLAALPMPVAILIGIWALAGIVFLANQWGAIRIPRLSLGNWVKVVSVDVRSQKQVASREELVEPTISDRLVEVAAIPRDGITVRGKHFINCDIMGPAVLFFQGHAVMYDTTFETPMVNAMFWEVPNDRPQVVGVLVFADCVFRGCCFKAIGIAGAKAVLEDLKRQVGGGEAAQQPQSS